MGINKTIQWWDEWTARLDEKHGNYNGHGKSLGIEVRRSAYDWDEYRLAIERWEDLTRPAPDPVRPDVKLGQRLSPRFSEWMMGLPDGWVTDVPGITEEEAHALIGNGVVPQQAQSAVSSIIASLVRRAAA